MTMRLTGSKAIAIFCVFALGYFLSSLVRGVTATLAPVLTTEFSLTSTQLGLLGGAYFLGFAALQLPLGNWLDRYGPKKVLLICLAVAVISCIAFAIATSYPALLWARFVGGVGVSACLIAPLTGARVWLDEKLQQSANAWMLMAGSLGLLSATLPVQLVIPIYGWRVIFLILAVLFAITMIGVAWKVPSLQFDIQKSGNSNRRSLIESYVPIFKNSYFRHIAFIGFVNYGVLVAVQTLWAGPWMTTVAGYSSNEAANGLFAVNLTMLFIFWIWGMINPRLHRAGLSAEKMMVWGLPLNFIALAAIAWLGPLAGWEAFACFCMVSSVLSLTHPAVGAAFQATEAGRAISAFNLLLFLGVFFTQWLVGASLDMLKAAQWDVVSAYRIIFLILSVCCGLSYLWFILGVHKRQK